MPDNITIRMRSELTTTDCSPLVSSTNNWRKSVTRHSLTRYTTPHSTAFCLRQRNYMIRIVLICSGSPPWCIVLVFMPYSPCFHFCANCFLLSMPVLSFILLAGLILRVFSCLPCVHILLILSVNEWMNVYVQVCVYVSVRNYLGSFAWSSKLLCCWVGYMPFILLTKHKDKWQRIYCHSLILSLCSLNLSSLVSFFRSWMCFVLTAVRTCFPHASCQLSSALIFLHFVHDLLPVCSWRLCLCPLLNFSVFILRWFLHMLVL